MAADSADKKSLSSMDAALAAAMQERLQAAAATDGEVSEEVFLGVVKSYNDRRGFGFLACGETAEKFGRDVYMAKTEATLAAAEAASAEGDAVALAAALALIEKDKEKEKEKGKEKENKDVEKDKEKEKGEKPPPAPRLAEEDLVRFRVRLSIEGYPQAVCVSRLRKFTGTVLRPPPQDSEVEATDAYGLISCEDVKAVHGVSEVRMTRSACGQVRLVAGDEVTFCTPDVAEGKPLQAQLVSLTKTARSNGSVLGCFALDLPRTGGGEDAPARPNLMLDCHAFGDKLILAGLPEDLDESELMRFFSKQGANSTIVAHARGCSFASISFPSVVEVARFLGRTAHAFADDKETRIAKLLALDTSKDVARLPALPAPTLTLGEEVGSLLVVWSPLVLALAYAVELRQYGGDSAWAAVDVSSNRLGGSTNRFDADCSCCKVTGLNVGVAYEARVSYFTECGTRSEPSEGSEPAMPASTAGAAGSIPPPAPPIGSGLTASGLGVAEGFGSTLPPASQPPLQPPTAVPGASAPLGYQPCPGLSSYGASVPSTAPPVPPQWYDWGAEAYSTAPLSDAYSSTAPPPPPPVPPYLPATSWPSLSGTLPPPAAPEVKPADEFGFALSIQWPAVLQATAYIVELREAGSSSFERFVRSAPEAELGTLVELRVGGLKPGPGQGRVYVAQVRTIAADGSESAPSPPSWSPPLPPAMQPTAATLCSGGMSTTPGNVTTGDAAATSALQGWTPPPWLSQPSPVVEPARVNGGLVAPATGVSQPPADKGVDKSSSGATAAPWATLGGPPPPPPGPPPAAQLPRRMSGEESPPEITGHEDCLILD